MTLLPRQSSPLWVLLLAAASVAGADTTGAATVVEDGAAVVDAVGQIATEEQQQDKAAEAAFLTNVTVETEPSAEDEQEEDFEDDDYDDEDDEDDYPYDDDIWDLEGPGTAFGVAQALTPEEVVNAKPFDPEAAQALIGTTADYMDQLFAIQEGPMVEARVFCLNYYQLCTIWAAQGECTVNPYFMTEECAPACQACDKITVTDEDRQALKEAMEEAKRMEEEGEFYDDEEDDDYDDEEEEYDDEEFEGPYYYDDDEAEYEEEEQEDGFQLFGGEFGTPQEMRPEYAHKDAKPFTMQQVVAKIRFTKDYMEKEVAVEEKYKPYRELCWNYYSMCAIWAVTGECEINPEFMIQECAPVCSACDKIDLEALAEENEEEEEYDDEEYDGEYDDEEYDEEYDEAEVGLKAKTVEEMEADSSSADANGFKGQSSGEAVGPEMVEV